MLHKNKVLKPILQRKMHSIPWGGASLFTAMVHVLWDPQNVFCSVCLVFFKAHLLEKPDKHLLFASEHEVTAKDFCKALRPLCNCFPATERGAWEVQGHGKE